MSKPTKLATDGGQALGQNPFGALSSAGLPPAEVKPGVPAPAPRGSGKPPGPASTATVRDQPNRNRGRVDIRRTTAGRGGKTVTVVDGFTGIGLPEKEQLAKRMQKICGCGGTVKDGRIEIQGDKRDDIARVLEQAGFRAVMAGG